MGDLSKADKHINPHLPNLASVESYMNRLEEVNLVLFKLLEACASKGTLVSYSHTIESAEKVGLINRSSKAPEYTPSELLVLYFKERTDKIDLALDSIGNISEEIKPILKAEPLPVQDELKIERPEIQFLAWQEFSSDIIEQLRESSPKGVAVIKRAKDYVVFESGCDYLKQTFEVVKPESGDIVKVAIRIAEGYRNSDEAEHQKSAAPWAIFPISDLEAFKNNATLTARMNSTDPAVKSSIDYLISGVCSAAIIDPLHVPIVESVPDSIPEAIPEIVHVISEFTRSAPRGSILTSTIRDAQIVGILLGYNPDGLTAKILFMPDEVEKSFTLIRMESSWSVVPDELLDKYVLSDDMSRFLTKLDEIKKSDFIILKPVEPEQEPDEPGTRREVVGGHILAMEVPEEVITTELASPAPAVQIDVDKVEEHRNPILAKPRRASSAEIAIVNRESRRMTVEKWFTDKIVPLIINARMTGDYTPLRRQSWIDNEPTETYRACHQFGKSAKDYWGMLLSISKMSPHIELLNTPVSDDEILLIQKAGEEFRRKNLSQAKTVHSPESCKLWVENVLKPYVLRAKLDGSGKELTSAALIKQFGYEIRKVAKVLSESQGEQGTTSVEWLLKQPYVGL